MQGQHGDPIRRRLSRSFVLCVFSYERYEWKQMSRNQVTVHFGSNRLGIKSPVSRSSGTDITRWEYGLRNLRISDLLCINSLLVASSFHAFTSFICWNLMSRSYSTLFTPTWVWVLICLMLTKKQWTKVVFQGSQKSTKRIITQKVLTRWQSNLWDCRLLSPTCEKYMVTRIKSRMLTVEKFNMLGCQSKQSSLLAFLFSLIMMEKSEQQNDI